MSILPMMDGDVQDFIEAQDELRSSLGVAVEFGVPTVPQWPAGTKVNPDTGEPYDATVVQANEEFEWTPVVALVIEREGTPGRARPDAVYSEAGLRQDMDIVLDCATADYDIISQASTFRALGKDYQAEGVRPYEIAGTTYRYLVFGAER